MAERDSRPCCARAEPEPFHSHSTAREGNSELSQWGLGAAGAAGHSSVLMGTGAKFPSEAHITHPHQELGCWLGLMRLRWEKLCP